MIIVGTCTRLSKKTNGKIGHWKTIATTTLVRVLANENLFSESSAGVICGDITPSYGQMVPGESLDLDHACY